MQLLRVESACEPWLAAGSRVALGLSGGRDSVALLRLLVMRGVQVCACHVHHGIRGAAADADADFCAALCRELADKGVVYEQHRVDVPALAAASGDSLETVARHERRRLLVSFARRHDCPAVALAHHADDQAETALFHLARGSAGLCGMHPVSKQLGVLWLRPLLGCRRNDITAWLQGLGQPWREDATNAVPDVARNALRLEVLPALSRAMGRDVTPVLCRSARLQGEVAEALQTALEQLPLLDPQGRLYLPALVGMPPAFRKAVVHYYLRRCGVSGISEGHVLAVCALLEPGSTANMHNLPGNQRARRAQKRLWIEEKYE